MGAIAQKYAARAARLRAVAPRLARQNAAAVLRQRRKILRAGIYANGKPKTGRLLRSEGMESDGNSATVNNSAPYANRRNAAPDGGWARAAVEGTRAERAALARAALREVLGP